MLWPTLLGKKGGPFPVTTSLLDRGADPGPRLEAEGLGFLSGGSDTLGAMRALIVFDVEVFEGVRPGTVFARLLRVAHKGGEFVGWLRHVEALHSVGVFPSTAADVLGPALIHVDGSELRILERVPVSRGG